MLVRPFVYRTAYIYYNPNRPSSVYMSFLFEDEAKVLPRLYTDKDFAGMHKYLDSVVQKSGDFWNYWRYETAPHIFCVQSLLAIQTNQFNAAQLRDTGFCRQLADYARIMRQMNRRGYSSYLFTNGVYGGNGLTDHFITFTRNWAKDLLANRQLSTEEAFLCKVFSGEITHPVNTILADKKTYSLLNNKVENSFKFDRRTGFFYNFLVSAGAWVPSGNLAGLGNHASIGYNLFGLRDRWNEYDLYFASRFIRAPKAFTFVNNDTVYTGRSFYSGYYGLDYTRYIISTPHFEAGIIGGIGVEDVQLKSFGGKKTADITSFSLSTGVRVNYFCTKFMYVGASCKQSWLSYKNDGGTNLNGNGLSADVYFGINILAANKGKK